MHSKASNKKKIQVITILAVVVCVLSLGIYFLVSYLEDRKTVEVVAVSSISSPYWGKTVNASGIVTNDLVQELFPDDTKVISSIFITEGAPVKIGDPILQYDKEWLELDKERKTQDLSVKDYEIEMTQEQLKKLQNTKVVTSRNASSPTTSTNPSTTSRAPTPASPTPSSPTQSPTPKPSPTPTPTPIPAATVKVYKVIEANAKPYKGTGDADSPYVFLCEPSYKIDPAFVKQMLGVDAYYTDPNDPSTGVTGPFVSTFEVRKGNSEKGDLIQSFTFDGINFSGAGETTASKASVNERVNRATRLLLNQSNTLTVTNVNTVTPTPTPTPTPTESPTASPTPTPSASPSSSSSASNYDDMNYTSSALTELIEEKKTEISSLQSQRKQMQIDLDKATLSLENSTVFSMVDGVVKSLLTLKEAKEAGTAFLVISGSDDYYLKTALPETLLGKISVGSVVTGLSYETGANYSCEIVSIDDNPITGDNYYSYGGNPNSSQYGCTAIIRDSSGLRSGMNIDVTLTTGEVDMNTLFIEKMYVREDSGGSYVYKRSIADGRLIKQYVNIGRVMDGWYIEILSDLTVEDYVAFPYGKDVKPRVRTSLDGDENAFGSFAADPTIEGEMSEVIPEEFSSWSTGEGGFETEFSDGNQIESSVPSDSLDNGIPSEEFLPEGGIP